MTFSILARDAAGRAIGGAAATGNLCVGGWVLRGEPGVGVSASQGASPSTFWGGGVLADMGRGTAAAAAVARITAADSGRDWRQLAALGPQGTGAAFTGMRNEGWCGAVRADGAVAAGNLLSGPAVLEAALAALPGPDRLAGDLAGGLLRALEAGAAAGGDRRGLQSAALLVVAPDAQPLSLRVDFDPEPLAALRALHARTLEPAYRDWLATVPVAEDPERSPG